MSAERDVKMRVWTQAVAQAEAAVMRVLPSLPPVDPRYDDECGKRRNETVEAYYTRCVKAQTAALEELKIARDQLASVSTRDSVL